MPLRSADVESVTVSNRSGGSAVGGVRRMREASAMSSIWSDKQKHDGKTKLTCIAAADGFNECNSLMIEESSIVTRNDVCMKIIYKI